jgi:hypothetical protein
MGRPLEKRGLALASSPQRPRVWPFQVCVEKEPGPLPKMPTPFPRVREIVHVTITAALGLAAAIAVATGEVTSWTAPVLTAAFVGLAGIRRSQ